MNEIADMTTLRDGGAERFYCRCEKESMVSQRHLEKSMANRESGLNVASRIDWAMRGERERKRRQRGEREDQEPRAENQENQESAWSKWQGYTGRRR